MEKLTPEQWKDKTIRELQRRKYLREKGIKDADSYQYDARAKSLKKLSKIRCKSYRGK